MHSTVWIRMAGGGPLHWPRTWGWGPARHGVMPHLRLQSNYHSCSEQYEYSTLIVHLCIHRFFSPIFPQQNDFITHIDTNYSFKKLLAWSQGRYAASISHKIYQLYHVERPSTSRPLGPLCRNHSHCPSIALWPGPCMWPRLGLAQATRAVTGAAGAEWPSIRLEAAEVPSTGNTCLIIQVAKFYNHREGIYEGLLLVSY